MAYHQQLYRSRENKMIGGVAGGLADYFRMDVSLIRILWVLSVFFGGSGFLAYLIAWLVIPEAGTVHIHSNETTTPTAPCSAPAADENRPFTQRLGWVGVLLIGLGILILVKDTIPWHLTKYIWPLFLIGFGLFLLAKRNRF